MNWIFTISILGLGFVAFPAFSIPSQQVLDQKNEAKIATCESKIERYDQISQERRDQLAKQQKFRLVLDGKLYYMGSEHSRDAEDPQVKQIIIAWEQFRPTFALYEGRDVGTGDSPKDAVSRFGEPALIRYLSEKYQVVSTSAEPSSKEKVEFLKSLFPAKQVELFYFMRTAEHLRNRAEGDEKAIRKFFTKVFYPLLEERKVAFEIKNLQMAQTEYEKYFKSPANWWQAPKQWFSPIHTSNETGGVFTNEINSEESHFRNLHSFRKIARQILAGDRVFVLYGGHHIPMQEAALRCLVK